MCSRRTTSSSSAAFSAARNSRPPESFDGAFNFCRLFYTSVRSEYGGQGWWTDYPDADTNFMIRLSELTKTRVSQDPDGTPNHVVVRADSPELFSCPFVTIEDAGTARFTDAEVAGLRAYLLKGGFLWSDDYWGTLAMESFDNELVAHSAGTAVPGRRHQADARALPHDVRVRQPSRRFRRSTTGADRAARRQSAATTARASISAASSTSMAARWCS